VLPFDPAAGRMTLCVAVIGGQWRAMAGSMVGTDAGALAPSHEESSATIRHSCVGNGSVPCMYGTKTLQWKAACLYRPRGRGTKRRMNAAGFFARSFQHAFSFHARPWHGVERGGERARSVERYLPKQLLSHMYVGLTRRDSGVSHARAHTHIRTYIFTTARRRQLRAIQLD